MSEKKGEQKYNILIQLNEIKGMQDDGNVQAKEIFNLKRKYLLQVFTFRLQLGYKSSHTVLHRT